MISKVYRWFFAVLMGMLFVSFSGMAEVETLHFNSLDLEDGLSQGSVYDIIRDHQGFLWIATKNGLNRYDGYEFKKFHYDPDKATSIPESSVKSLYEDSENRLWIGFESRGFASYDNNTGQFAHFPFPEAEDKINAVFSIAEGPQGNLWLGSTEGRMLKFNPSDSTFKKFQYKTSNKESIQTLGKQRVKAIEQDKNDHLWFSVAYNGLFEFDPIEQEILNAYNQSERDRQRFDYIESITADDDRLWIGTKGEIIQKDLDKERFDHYDVFEEEDFFITSIHSEYKKYGELWASCLNTGLIRFRPGENQIRFHQNAPQKGLGLNLTSLNVVYKDTSSIFWLGTNGRGVNWFSGQKKFSSYNGLPSEKHGQLNPSTRGMTEDHEGNIWIGSYTGLDKYDPSSGKVKGFPFEDSQYPYNSNIFSVFEDSKNRLWMGSEGGGLYRVDRDSEAIIHVERTVGKHIYGINEGPEGHIWLGTGDGFLRYDPESEEIKRFLYEHWSKHHQLH